MEHNQACQGKPKAARAAHYFCLPCTWRYAVLLMKVHVKSIFCGIILFAITGCASPEISIDYTLDEMIWAPWLRIQVAPTFEPPEEYQVNRHDPHMLVYKVYSGSGGYDWGKAHKILRISLTTEQHDKVKELADKVLTEFPLRDEVIGFDGTTWILESSIYQYTKL